MKKILFILTISASLFIIKDLVGSIYSLWSKKDLLSEAQKELQKEQQENMRLKAQLAESQQYTFVEAEARNKLFLVKPGESVVVLPQSDDTQKKQAKLIAKTPLQEWWGLFFY